VFLTHKGREAAHMNLSVMLLAINLPLANENMVTFAVIHMLWIDQSAKAWQGRSMTDFGTPITRKNWLIFGFAIPAVTVALDQLTKYAATRFFKVPMNICETNPAPGFDYDLWPIMDIALVCNQGISWGLLQGDSPVKRWLLTAFAFLMCGFLYWTLKHSRDNLSRLSLALVIGGAIGNGIDRLLFGAVTDFIDFGDIGFHWVFNIADSAITVGVIGLILASFRNDRAEKAAKRSTN